jgi:hypothetical protein
MKMYRSVMVLEMVDIHVVIRGLEQVPGTATFQARSTGLQRKMLAKKRPSVKHDTKAMPRLIRVKVKDFVEKIRR